MYNDNKKKILNAVKRDASALQYVGADLMSDKEFILEAMNQNGLALEYGITYSWFLGCIKYKIDYREASDVVLAAVKQNGRALEHASKELQGDKEVVLAAVKQNSRALEHASKELQGDKEFVLAAVNQDGWVLQYADADLRKDKEVVLAALKTCSWALEYAHPDLRKDKEFILKMVNQDGINLKYADISLQNDIDVVLAAVKHYDLALHYAHADLQNNKEVVLAALKKSDLALKYCYTYSWFLFFIKYEIDYRKSFDVVYKAVSQNGHALRYAGMALKFASEALQNDKDFILEAVKEEGLALEYVTEALQNDKEVVFEAVKQNGMALMYVDASLKKDKEVVLAAVQQNVDAWQYASDTLRSDRDILLAISVQCQNSEKYLNHTIDRYKISQELLKQTRPDLLSMIPHNRLGEFSNICVKGVDVKGKNKLVHFNIDVLRYMGEYLNYIEKQIFISAVGSQRVSKGLSLFTHGLNKLKGMAQDDLNKKPIKNITPMLFHLAHRAIPNEQQALELLTKNVDMMRNALIKKISESSEVGSIEHMALFFKVASKEDACCMVDLIQTTLNNDQEAREYFVENNDQLPDQLKEAVFPDVRKFPNVSKGS